MKISSVSVSNVLGAREVNVPIVTPVTIFVGPNGNGKTSILEAVRMAMTGQPARDVNLKKNYSQLITEGATAGQASVTCDAGEYWMMLPTGKGSHATENPSLPYVLDATRLAALSDKDRKTFLFGLLGLKITGDVVKERMKKRGLDMAKAERVVPLLRAGFEEASKHAAEQATQSKGAWKAVANEQWGSEKAETWSAAVPEFDQAELDALLASAKDTDQALADANQQLGALVAQSKQSGDIEARRAALEQSAAKIDRIEKKLKVDEAEHIDLHARLATLRASLATQDAMACPQCNSMLVLRDGCLEHVDPADAKGTDHDLARIPALEHAIDLGNKAIANDRRDLAAAQAAKAELATMDKAGTKPIKESDIMAARDKAQSLKADRDELSAQIDALNAAKRAAESAAENTKKAASHHADIMAWLAIADALGANGIPGEMLAEALGPLNSRLEQSADDTGWPKVRVGTDMSITYGGRLHQLLSKSEKWRANAMLTEAVSYLSGLKFFTLDEFDILDMPGRAQALAWLDTLAINSEIDTVLVGATLKSTAANWAASTSAYWVSHGVCTTDVPALQAA